MVRTEAYKNALIGAKLSRKTHPSLISRGISHLEVFDRKLVFAMERLGIVDPWDTLHAVRHVNAGLAISCTSLLMESSGGINEFGADPGGDALPIQWFDTSVTKLKYLTYKGRVERGYTPNGVGPCQLTDFSLQLGADARGGCWIPLHNMTEGFNFLKILMKEAGSTYNGFRDYNGSGPAAEDYANRAINILTSVRNELNKVK